MGHPSNQDSIYKRLEKIESRLSSLDISEKLPEEGGWRHGESDWKLVSKDQASAHVNIQAPTMTASDGNEYPFEYWTTQQRFDEVKPPEGVAIRVCDPTGAFYEMERSDDVVYDLPMGLGTGHKMVSDLSNCTWTIAPLPAVEKQEAVTIESIYRNAAMLGSVVIRMNNDTQELWMDLPDDSILSQAKGG